jgi:hypothetical protein
LVDLPVGTFVCSYVGEILTDVMADLQGRQGGDEYYADLDLISNVLEEKERQGIDLIQDVGYFDGTTGGDENVASKSPSVDRLVVHFNYYIFNFSYAQTFSY